jgi:pheromone alpha factor receptor
MAEEGNPGFPTAPAGYDPLNANVTFLDATGTPFNITMAELNYYRMFEVNHTINYASQFGASAILLAVLFLLTRREKRFSLIFFLNAFCLFLNSIRSLLQCLLFTSMFNHPYTNASQDYSFVTDNAIATSIAAGVITALLFVFIMISLTLQVHVVLVTTPRRQRFWIMAITTTIALLAVGVRFAVTVLNAKAIAEKSYFFAQWLVNFQTIMQAIAIWTFCIIFTIKLGIAIRQRRKLGMRQFGPMQIIFIMGCQTMVLPAIMAVLQFINKGPELGSLTLTLVVIFLPLSAIWASVVVNDIDIAASGPDSHLHLLRGTRQRSAQQSSPSGSKTRYGSSTVASSKSKEPESPVTPREKMHYGRDNDIMIERDWTVEKEAARKV